MRTRSPPYALDMAMSYDAANQQVVMYGGSTSHDTWTWDGTNWTRHPSP